MNIIELPGGFKVPDDQLMSKWQVECGKLNHDEFLIPLACANIPVVSGGSVIIDVGAMAGDHTISYCKKAGPDSHVIAIEAGKIAFDCLVHNAEKFEGAPVICVNAAVCDVHGGTARHTVNATNVGGSIVSNGTSEEVSSNEIRTITIDGLCQDAGINEGSKPVSFIKLDIEGYELLALKGAINTLRKYRPILLIEFNSFRLAENGASYREIYDFLLKLNYDWRICQPELKGGDSQYDCLCWPNSIISAKTMPNG